MRLREPKIEQPKSEIARPKEQPWQKFDVELITPIFGGGVTAGNPDEDMPIRAAAIRGQLRYWWRFLYRNKYKGQRLFDEERKIWGGVGERDTGFSSRVRLKLGQINNINIAQYDGKLAGYALFPARETQEFPAKKLIHKGLKFSLQIYCLESGLFNREVLPALRWWATFGGIGARTRRGVGSVKVAGLAPITETEAEDEGCKLAIYSSREKLSATDAWKRAVGYLQEFRQGASIGRNHKKDESGNLLYHDQKEHVPQLGRSSWPEPDSIREIVNTHSDMHSPSHKARLAFPRAAFGLPIIFKFKDDNHRDPQQSELLPINTDRMASPLILTAYPQGNGAYAPAALLLPNKEILDSLALSLSTEPDNNAPRLKRRGWDKWSTNWWDSNKASNVSPINDYAGTDALSAFMNFFAQGGQKPCATKKSI